MVYDSFDIKNSYLEGQTLFVATRVNRTLRQKKSLCLDYSRNCTTDTDCFSFLNEECKKGFCKVNFKYQNNTQGPNWCFGKKSSFEVDDFDKFMVRPRSQIKFFESDKDSAL